MNLSTQTSISQGTENEFLLEDEQIEENEDVISLNEYQAFEEKYQWGIEF